MLQMKYGLPWSLILLAAVSLGFWGQVEPGALPLHADGMSSVAWAAEPEPGEPPVPPSGEAEPGVAEPAPSEDVPVEPPPADPQPPAKPQPPVEEVVPTADANLSPELLRFLTAALTTDRKHPAVVTAPENVTVLSVPDKYAVYFATVDEIRDAEAAAGGSIAVEDVVFNDLHFMGYTPVTFPVPAGDHVLAIRAMSRQDGFDADCVRKSTRDVITGGRRHSYHLYPLRKHVGEYQCFVANFVTPDVRIGDLDPEMLARGSFAIPLADLVTELAASTYVPEQERESVAVSLNQLGVAFYRQDATVMLVKLSLVGNSWEIGEWAVESGEAE